MSRIESVNLRYVASAALAQHGVEVVAVHDVLGAQLDAFNRSLFRLIQREGPGVWDDLAGAVKVLRWRLITDPVPINSNAQVKAAVEEVGHQAHRLKGAVENEALLQELANAAGALLTRDSPVGSLLVASLAEVGPDAAIAVAASSRSREALGEWLEPMGTRVLTLGDLERAEVSEDITYFVGPPRFFKPSAITAPRTEEVTFLFPAWFGDRAIPTSAIAQYAEGGIQVPARLMVVGDPPHSPEEQRTPESEPIPEDELLPQPVWGIRRSEDRPPNSDEVEARKVLLSGNRAIWLDDDGERIRALDPAQPPGERVGYCEVSAVAVGTYLLLREGEAEREWLRAEAYSRLGARGEVILQSQGHWKALLAQKIDQTGFREAERLLRMAGVGAAGQVRAWTSTHLIRPQDDGDFKKLLAWLDLPLQPYFGHASLLRQEVHRATRELRERLEAAADATDINVLKRAGHLTLDVAEDGFRGMFVTRVIAIAPFTEIVARNSARVPFEDKAAQWLE